MKQSILIVFTLFVLSKNNVLGQITLSGKVIDSSNKEVLMGTSIQVEKENSKTISNEEGDFEIKVEKLPVMLLISHIGYKKVRLVIDKAEGITISLSQEPVQLPEVRVGNPAIAILNAMIQKSLLMKNDTKFYRAFYRRISSNNGDISRFQEMFANVAWTIDGISEWQPINIRYAEDSPLPSRNLYFLSFLHSASIHKNIGFPINSTNIDTLYSLKIKTYININTSDETAIISFESLDKKRYGEIYVNTQKDQLLKIKEYQKIQMQKKGQKTLFFEASFSENESKQVVFDQVFITETTGRTLDIRKASERIWLYFQNEISTFDKMQVYPAFLKNDTQIILSIPYDANFWKNNTPFALPTSTKKMIEKMEKSSGFKANFN